MGCAMKEEELEVMQLLAGTAGKPWKAGEKHATDSSLETPRETTCSFRTSNLQNHEQVHFCCL